MMRTRLLSLMIAVLMAAGCSSGAGSGASVGKAVEGEEAGGSEAAAVQEPVKLKFSIWGNDAQKAMVEGLVDEYEQLHPGMEVEIMTIPFADYQQKLSIMLASRTAPDAGWLAERMIPQLLESGQLVDIAAEVKEDPGYNYADIYPSTLDIFKREDRLYGIPFSTPPVLIYYNKDLFLEKGLKTPTELYKEGKWNYEEFLKAARSLTDSQQGIYGVKLVRDWNNWSDALLPLFWSHGAELFDSSATAFALNSPAGREALQLYSDMMFKDKVHPLPGDELTFDSGRIGMYTDRYSYTSKARAVTDFDWDIAPMPAGVKGTGTSLGYAGVSVFETRHPAEAAEFLKFITSAEAMSVTAQYFVPSRKSVLESDVFLRAASKPSPESIQLAVLDQIADARIAPGHKNWQQIDTKIQRLLDGLYTQSSTVDGLLGQMEVEVGPLMK
ncbi:MULTISPECIES: sugar ABC transporter substrate-binding protein [Paenibacillus]|jgi:multiple sugar transport system substrate-binding protein|uniref:ABC transporter substrate-binding protein n=1 Tax=Paenibacillus TaxID=44249 RepID=UPI0009F97B32|nr:sugar ABC transporter substrate-binding protein [Paenibacillus sp. FSL H8-0259]